MIKDENKWDTLFGVPASRKTVKMSPGVLERVFDEFKFRSINRTSSKNIIYKNIINTTFGFNIIMSKTEDGHVSYFINEEIEKTLFKLEKMCKEASAINPLVRLQPLEVDEDDF